VVEYYGSEGVTFLENWAVEQWPGTVAELMYTDWVQMNPIKFLNPSLV
jgi:hypothetical protein